MTVRFEDAFSSDSSADYDGAGLTVAGGIATLDSEGLTLHQTECPGTEIWMRVIIDTVDGTNAGPCIADASGNGFIVMFKDTGPNLQLKHFVEYDTYTTYPNNDDYNINATIGGTDRTKQHGLTFDLTNNTVRIWDDVTANEPDSISSWDSVAADVTSDYGTLGQTQDGNYLGWGTWNTGTPNDAITYIAGGDISVASQSDVPYSRSRNTRGALLRL